MIYGIDNVNICLLTGSSSNTHLETPAFFIDYFFLLIEIPSYIKNTMATWSDFIVLVLGENGYINIFFG